LPSKCRIIVPVVQAPVVQEWADREEIDLIWGRVASEVLVMGRDARAIAPDAKVATGLHHHQVMRVLDPSVNKVDAF
jgi:hypothetical protein